MRMVGKTMLIRHQRTPLVTDQKLLVLSSQSCPPLIAFHNNLSNSCFHSARNFLFAFAGKSLIAPLIILRKGKDGRSVDRQRGRAGSALVMIGWWHVNPGQT